MTTVLGEKNQGNRFFSEPEEVGRIPSRSHREQKFMVGIMPLSPRNSMNDRAEVPSSHMPGLQRKIEQSYSAREKYGLETHVASPKHFF